MIVADIKQKENTEVSIKKYLNCHYQFFIKYPLSNNSNNIYPPNENLI